MIIEWVFDETKKPEPETLEQEKSDIVKLFSEDKPQSHPFVVCIGNKAFFNFK